MVRISFFPVLSSPFVTITYYLTTHTGSFSFQLCLLVFFHYSLRILDYICISSIGLTFDEGSAEVMKVPSKSGRAALLIHHTSDSMLPGMIKSSSKFILSWARMSLGLTFHLIFIKIPLVETLYHLFHQNMAFLLCIAHQKQTGALHKCENGGVFLHVTEASGLLRKEHLYHL